MGEAKRRREWPGPSLIPLGGWAYDDTDFGMSMWDNGRYGPHRVNFMPGYVVDHGSHRDVTGTIHVDDEDLNITVRTMQTYPDVKAHRDMADHGSLWAYGDVDNIISRTWEERRLCRMLIGKVITREEAIAIGNPNATNDDVDGGGGRLPDDEDKADLVDDGHGDWDPDWRLGNGEGPHGLGNGQHDWFLDDPNYQGD